MKKTSLDLIKWILNKMLHSCLPAGRKLPINASSGAMYHCNIATVAKLVIVPFALSAADKITHLHGSAQENATTSYFLSAFVVQNVSC